MAITTLPGTRHQTQADGKNYLFPFILVTSLFFLWGLAYGLLDVLNKHFQETLKVGKGQSTLLQMAYFGAYFLIALPAGIFMNRYGYKKGVITGLLLYASGAFLFYPSALQGSFNFFLLSLFILASGLAFLETAANPYVTVLGEAKSSEFRLNLSQSFNGVGSFIGPIVAAQLFFGKNSGGLDSVKIVYVVIGTTVLMIAGLFWRTKLPEIKESELVSEASQDTKPLFQHKNFTGAIVAQFFYVAAQVGIAALFINYCTEASSEITNEKAAYLLSFSLAIFTAGRFAGTAIMKKIAPHKLLFIYSLINIILCLVVVTLKSSLSVYALMTVFFFESIMFPTIFALGVKDLGHHTKKASSFIIMSIVGGAVMPYVMGLVAEKFSTATAYLVPVVCFLITAWYGQKGYKTK
jgi:FHS family L-fucose permease-like MFS transporter